MSMKMQSRDSALSQLGMGISLEMSEREVSVSETVLALLLSASAFLRQYSSARETASSAK